ncbi:hypothetical protein M378DRAFT_9060 [Amanita muscaria Koide BX008]|uniref:Uncharacterized protein n=1 Tax=Amanita muscaria (strain Koide BX008) TaxID=946122 RepID=A0A0C2X0Z5_AMAMK|nr:hypothetical protein M378DRAFT_9060 [Amanita muscaria Koide BX008]
MPPTITVSSLEGDHIQAAGALSRCLLELNYPHAYIGGFAWSLLGSVRPTHDIDILIKLRDDQVDMMTLRDRLAQMDSHFATTPLNFYFTCDPVDPQQDVLQQIAQRTHNVLIETLRTGSLGLPETPEPLFIVEIMKLSLPILHPSILILTKLKRWCQTHTSTRPLTRRKAMSDRQDIEYLILWMSNRSMTIDFEQYQGKSKDTLLALVRELRDVIHSEDHTEMLGALRNVVTNDDWHLL